MMTTTLRSSVSPRRLSWLLLACAPLASWAGQAPRPLAASDIAISHRDRVYAAEQFSNTVSVTDPVDNRVLGVIRLGDPTPRNLSPLYRGQLLVHGLGFSPDGRTLAVVSIGSNSVTFIDTATNAVKHVTYVGRSPHEAFFTPDGSELWVTVRGENYIAVIDARTYEEKARIEVPGGPGMQIFSPDGKYGYVCSSFNPETVVIDVAERRIVGRVKQESPFCPNIAATPDGKQVWLTLKDIGKVMVFDARPPFGVIRTLDTGPTTNHVNFAVLDGEVFAYITVGGRNEVRVFRTADFESVASIAVGNLPHGLWPSGDGTRMYIGLENENQLAVVDTRTNKLLTRIPAGQAAQAVVYVPNAVPEGNAITGLQPLSSIGKVSQLELAPAGGKAPVTNVALFEQGYIQMLQASVNALEPRRPYVLALSRSADGSGELEPLAEFTTNPAGSAVVNALGPLRDTVRTDAPDQRRYLVIVAADMKAKSRPLQVQVR